MSHCHKQGHALDLPTSLHHGQGAEDLKGHER